MHARIYPTTLTRHPDDVNPNSALDGVAKFPNQYLERNNDLGAFRSGVSLQSCAAHCRVTVGCKSFDAGLADTISEGACFLSSLNRQNTGAVMKSSANFGFYEI